MLLERTEKCLNGVERRPMQMRMKEEETRELLKTDGEAHGYQRGPTREISLERNNNLRNEASKTDQFLEEMLLLYEDHLKLVDQHGILILRVHSLENTNSDLV